MLYLDGLPQTQCGLADRSHLRSFQNADGSYSTSPASTANNMATDGENQQKDGMLINSPDDQGGYQPTTVAKGWPVGWLTNQPTGGILT
jgi:hypothetical protein